MTTRAIRARNLTTAHELVEQGSRRREGRKVCEVAIDRQTVVARVRMPSGLIERRTFAAQDHVRVVEAGA